MNIKNLYLSLPVLLLLPVESPGAESFIRHVEIYPSGAAVTREIVVVAHASGMQPVEIDNLPARLLGSSIQIAPVGESDVRIGGFSFNPEGNPVEEDDERTAEMRESIERINDSIDALKAEQKSIEGRIQYYSVVAQSIRLSLEEEASPEAFELARTAWAEMESVRAEGRIRLVELKKEIQALEREVINAREDLGERVQELSGKSGVLAFDLGAAPGPVKLLLRYQVREAGWSPVHEIRATPATGTVSWIYKARIHQDSGEDWTDVQVSLNSASALNAAGLPNLDPLFLYRREREIGYADSVSLRRAGAVAEAKAPMMQMEAAVPESTTTGFFIRLPQTMTLESGQDPVVREAFTGELEADFWSEAVPEFSTEAWLMAGMVNELGWPILAGESYSYIDGQLVARRHIQEMAAGEDIELSLGRNEKISIERKERVKKESEGGLIDRTRRHDIKYETTVENRMEVGHRVVLKDRFPIGRDNKIQVRIESPEGVEPEEGTGIFEWERTLEPGKSAVMTTEYTVSYPAEWVVWPPLR